MLKKLFLIITLGLLLSGCFMVPLAMVGPAVSGFNTASIMQSSVTTTASYLIKKSTGKSIAEHALDTIAGDILKQTYFPVDNSKSIVIENSNLKNK
jgi:hypothetical protein